MSLGVSTVIFVQPGFRDTNNSCATKDIIILNAKY